MRVVCLEFSTEHVSRAVARFCAEQDFDIVLWTGSAEFRGKAEALVPGVPYLANMEAIRGAAPTGVTPLPPGNDLLKDLAACECLTLPMMDRMDPSGRAFPYRERIAHYHRLVAVWQAFILHAKPDLLLMPVTPHLVYDYVAYCLFKRAGIRTLMFDRTAFPGRVYVDDRFDGETPIAGVYRALLDNGTERLPPVAPDIVAEVERQRGIGLDALSANHRMKVESGRMSLPQAGGRSATRRLASNLRTELRKTVNRMKSVGPWGKAPRNYLKQAGRTMADSWMPAWEWHWHRLAGLIRKERLLREYESLQGLPDLSQPYIFCALQYQPERTTSPLAEFMVHQLAAVRMISHLLPDGWRIYVKEHPWSFDPASRGHLSRWRGYYRELAAMPGVQLVPVSVPSTQLVDSCRATVTLSGSLGFQAPLRGKPALIFGKVWFREAEGVFHISSRDDAERALAACAAGYVPDPLRIQAFLAAVDQTTVRAWLEPGIEATGDVGEDECLDNLVGLLRSALSPCVSSAGQTC